MKSDLRKLKRVIRESIEEVATPGDTRYKIAGDARGGIKGRNSTKGVSFPGHPDEYEVIRKGFDKSDDGVVIEIPDYLKGQDLRDFENWYIDNIGFVQADGKVMGGEKEKGFFDFDTGKFYPTREKSNMADEIEEEMPDYGRDESEFFLLIDSGITRGKAGMVKHVPTRKSYSVSADRNPGSLAGDLYWRWQKSSGKTARQRSVDVIECLIKNDFLGETLIDDSIIKEIGVKGQNSKKVYGIEEYFSEFNSGVIKEAKKRNII